MNLKQKTLLFTSVFACMSFAEYALALRFNHPAARDVQDTLARHSSAVADGAGMLWAVTTPAITETTKHLGTEIANGASNMITAGYAATATTPKAPENNSLPQVAASSAEIAPSKTLRLFDFIAPASGEEQNEKQKAATPNDVQEKPQVVVTPPPKNDIKKSLWGTHENEENLTVDAVLVPARDTVISSSQDGKILAMAFQNGDKFRKGDVLLQYDCADLEAEAEMAGYQKDLAHVKSKGMNQLFKLDIISDMDRMNIETETRQARAKMKIYEAKLSACTIKADFDGHVTKRMANPGEYTRTDRVLMEVASDEPLEIEFLIPSKWLRSVNVGAPLRLTLNENDRNYEARVTRIFGSVDPVSQSIQIRAALEDYQEPLLPGMSGKATLSAAQIENAGVMGYLQTAER